MPSTSEDRISGISTSVAVKAPCTAVELSNITLAGLQGYTDGDRVLCVGQTSGIENGIYSASSGSWTRAKDFDGNRDVVQGTRVLVAFPDSSPAAEYELTTANPIVIGTTSLAFTLRYGANVTYDRTAAEIAAGVTPTNYAYAPGNVLRYGTNTTPGTTNMAAAFAAARDAYGVIDVPEGTYYLGSALTVASLLFINGAGSEKTIIQGDTDLFTLTTASSSLRLSGVTLQNVTTRSNLVNVTYGSDIGQSYFSDVYFKKANRHIYAQTLCVAWIFENCYFNDAALQSRNFKGIWAYREFGCYTWFNAAGLYVTGTSSNTCSFFGSVFEYQNGAGVQFIGDAVASEVLGLEFVGCHFEGNGVTGDSPDVSLSTTAATRIRSVQFTNCSWGVVGALQTTQRVEVSAAGGGSIDGVRFVGGIVNGAVNLCADLTAIIIDPDVYFQTVGPRASNRVTPFIQYQNRYTLGARYVAGAAAGSSAVLATITPPAGTVWADIKVQGNSYNGGANTHDGYLAAIYRASGNRVTALNDVNHSAGSNQGFAATWTGSAIQIANKGSLTNNQSGDIIVTFWGTP